MPGPLFYILAPFGLAMALFAVYLVVSLLLRDPARPFRMFAAGPLHNPADEARRLLDELEDPAASSLDDGRLRAVRDLAEGLAGKEWDDIRRRLDAILDARAGSPRKGEGSERQP